MYAMVPSGDPQAMKRQPIAAIETKRSRKPRDLKTYKNPHNGEVVQTKGGNPAVLKAWKAQYGGNEVESWLQ